MRVATHFIHPLVEDQVDRGVSFDTMAESAFPDVEDFEQLPMGELFAHFSANDLDWLQP